MGFSRLTPPVREDILQHVTILLIRAGASKNLTQAKHNERLVIKSRLDFRRVL